MAAAPEALQTPRQRGSLSSEPGLSAVRGGGRNGSSVIEPAFGSFLFTGASADPSLLSAFVDASTVTTPSTTTDNALEACGHAD